MQYPIIESIGIEFETDYIVRNHAQRVDYFNTDHDASIESYGYVHNNMLFKNKPKHNSEAIVMGTEYKSTVFSFNVKDDIYEKICGFLSQMENNGDSYQSNRSGIHVHVCSPYNANILKSILRACAHLEQVFFYLGGMGYTNRGVINEFSFCRPITKYGPVLVPAYNGKYCQAFNLEDLYNTTTVEDFFWKYGFIDYTKPPSKYIPIRYHWVQLYTLLTYGTVEFRIFNKTYNPLYLYTVVKFCQQLVNLSLNHKFTGLPENSIYDVTDKKYIIETLKSFIYKFDLDLDEKDIAVLCDIINTTPEMRLRPKYCVTHLANGRDLNRIFSSDYHTTIVEDRDDYIVPNVTTIHNIRQDNNPILG